ncbi:amidohydrolase family protein [Vibrio sp. SS-MA-C1-2]|uniref:amidohydrolase n=1 Tax=Vibrio sp. SS-MA-C1-2 TaxID=2908646 RepID=UPI001F3412E8|nr:amidohydrolase [Vibrio sp. SS-MA-C1-2]UJF17965.1 amidohydrolase family protein [Vibrio sp. SS-MA-C1-2]
MYKSKLTFVAISISVLLAGCDTHSKDFADKVYSGGTILTMVGDTPNYVDTIAIKDGKIIFAGEEEQLSDLVDDKTEQIDLEGKTLLPGFIDAHGHAFNSGFQSTSANLFAPPDGEGKSISEVISILKQWTIDNPKTVEEFGMIIGYGYDDSQLAEKRHPTAKDLDKVSTELPVIIIHQSGHLGSMNSKAMTLFNYDKNIKDPLGGVIRRKNDNVTPNGVMEEMALFNVLIPYMAKFPVEVNEQLALAGIDNYVQFGYTTAQEGRASAENSETWRKLAKDNKLPIDVAVYPDIQAAFDYMKESGVQKEYDNHFRIAGVKLSLDGSPQGKTAWLTEPYYKVPEGMPDDYKGYPAIEDPEERQKYFDIAFDNNWQMLIHGNGDAAQDAIIEGVKKAGEKFGSDDRRSVMIHAQMLREDQLDQMKELEIIPSFYSLHTFYWGDWHRDEVLGSKRAERISPTGSALKRGMRFTEHHDAPVLPPNAIMILDTTVNRTTRSGDVLGEDQRVSPYIALKSITDWAAWQYFEEESKGTLEVGKLADLVILDNNPLTVNKKSIKDIKVLETIKEGITVYKK